MTITFETNERGEQVRVTITDEGEVIRELVIFPPPTSMSLGTKMTKYAFRTRFTSTEKAAIEYASFQNTLEAAHLRASLADQRDAEHIDLARSETIDGLHDLESVGLIGEGRADTILNTPLTEKEVYRG